MEQRRGAAVLIVEDNPRMLAVISDMLTAAGHRTTACADPRDALRMLVHQTFDVVITDVVMPPPGGFGLLSALHESRPGIRVIVISGYVDGEFAEKARLKGAVAFLEKPFSKASLLRAVDQAWHGTEGPAAE